MTGVQTCALPIYTNGGEGRAYGLELLLRHRPHGPFFGWIAYTLSRAERRVDDGSWTLFPFDQTHILSALGSLQLGKSWTVGLKFKYFLGKDDKKFRPFVGAFGGYGTARLRVDMGFTNDRNGNSVPDSLEVGSHANTQDDCFPVWPYNNSCENSPAGDADDLLAAQVSTSAPKANRVDVVRIGAGFVGAMVGFNYQIAKHFALFGELGIGVWFPNQTSVLFDLTVGPSITF